MINKMNAIQYFDWGGVEKVETVSLITVVKDFFSKPIGYNIKDLFPIQKPYRAYLMIAPKTGPSGYSPSADVERNEIYKQGNDLVFKFFFKNNSPDRNIEIAYLNLGIHFHEDYKYFPNYSYKEGSFKVNGRKIKYGEFFMNRIFNAQYSLDITITSRDRRVGYDGDVLQYEDGEIITLKKLYNKEITLELF
jgi:hypothetical protein